MKNLNLNLSTIHYTLYSIILFLLIVGCGSSTFKSEEPNLSKTESIEKVPKKNSKEENKNLKLKQIPNWFPQSLKIIDWGASVEDGIHYFYSDGMYIYEHNTEDSYSKQFDVGEWKKGELIIEIILNKKIGYRGVGERNIVEGWQGAAHPIYEHDKYFNFEQFTNDKIELDLLVLFYGYDNEPVDTTQILNEKTELDSYKIKGSYREASMRPLINDEMGNLSKSELRLMRNEIFARYGLVFRSKDLDTYFRSQEWYRPNFNKVDRFLTELEKENISIILEFE